MNKTTRMNRVGRVAFAGAVFAGGILFAGCGQAPQGSETPAAQAVYEQTPIDEAMPGTPEFAVEVVEPEQKTQDAAQEKAPAPAPAPAKPAPAKVAPPKAAPEADFVKLFKEQQKYKKSDKKSESADKDFAAKWESITAGMAPKTLIDGLDVLAVDTQATGPKEYTFSFLLHSTADLDTDYHLSVTGKVDPAHVQHIKPAKPGANFATWPLYLYNDPTSKWKAGEYHVAQLKVDTEPIPYDLSAILQTRDEQRKWTGNPGNRVELGWQTDAGEFVKLFAQQQEYEKAKKQSKAADEAFAAKWKAVTADMKPKTLIEGLDVLAVDTQATGPKEYTFSFLLHSTADLDTDYHLSVTGKVDPAHVQHIKPAKPGANFATWPLFLYNDPTSKWKAGEYHVAQLKVDTEIIPYKLSVILQTRDEQRKWTGNPGSRVELGWQADVAE